METKQFHISTVFTIATGRLMTHMHPDYVGRKDNNGFGQVYEILNFMTGDDLYTHQLGRGAKQCVPFLPECTKTWNALAMETVALAENDGVAVVEYLERLLTRLTALHGEWLDVQTVPADKYAIINPIEELAMIIGRANQNEASGV